MIEILKYQKSAGFESNKVDHFSILNFELNFLFYAWWHMNLLLGENIFMAEDAKRNFRDNFAQFSSDETTSFTYIRNNDEGFEPRTVTGQDSVD